MATSGVTNRADRPRRKRRRETIITPDGLRRNAESHTLPEWARASFRASADRIECLITATRDAVRILDNPPGITFEEMCSRNVEAWKRLRAALRAGGRKRAKGER